MEYMREDAEEKEEASTQTSNSENSDSTEVEVATIMNAWQEQKASGNWATNRIKTFGKKQINVKFRRFPTYFLWHFLFSVSEKKVLPGAVLLVGFIYASFVATFYFG